MQVLNPAENFVNGRIVFPGRGYAMPFGVHVC